MKNSYYLILPLLLLLSFLTLTESGFCYKEKRYLTALERVSRVVQHSRFKDEIPFSPDLSMPVNCIPAGNADEGGVAHFLNLLKGQKFYSVECVYPKGNQTSLNQERYTLEASITDACATRIVDFTGGDISIDGYNAYLKENTKFWQEQRK